MQTQEKKSIITGPSVWVACLAAYNSGILHGAWVNVPSSAEAMQEEIEAIIKGSPCPDAEEWAFHDYSDFAPFGIHEFEDINTLVMKANILNDLSGDEIDAFGYWDYQEYSNEDEHDILERFRDEFVGVHKSGSDYAWDYFHEFYSDQIQGPFEWFLDWDRAWEYMVNAWGYYSAQVGFEKCYVFRGN